MRNRKSNIAVLLILAFFIAGCQSGCTQASNVVKTFKDMTPKEKSTYFMGIYNRQFNDTMVLANTPNLSEEQKKVVRTKKDILTRMYPAISTYDQVAVAGGTPSAEIEAGIQILIEQLMLATGGK
jgi:PBP1b-binding outer membrane lipoprotein LpoB